MLLRAQTLALGCLAIGGCGDDPGTPPPAREFADPGFVFAGDVRLHYALTLTSDLPPAIAGSYDIVQRRNLALLAITLAPAAGAGTERLAAIDLNAEAVTLIGERQALPLRRVDEAGGPTYLATVTVRHREPITIEIRARTVADGPEITARWTREFYLE
ncbi:MAG: DUF4426 domain-containing protein [Lysobacterales bacterium]|nr:MAG: DUF4426 domain-containing protein [Xanthomonadales bacterium]